MEVNATQTPITEELLSKLSGEYKSEFYEALKSIPLLEHLVSPKRKYARDMPRDDLGRIIVDIEKPHILEDVDYFRPSAINFKKYGKFTNLFPNPAVGSEYRRFWEEEINRCTNGYVRESDGEWVTGYHYFYLNYCVIDLVAIDEFGKNIKVEECPKFWDGDYWWFHYVEKCEREGKHGVCLKSRRRGYEQPNSEIVMTPYGETTIGNLRVGDLVIGRNGKPIRVIDVIPQGKKDIYEVGLHDHRSVRCGLNHLWGVYNTKNHYVVVNTKFLLDSNLKQRPNTPKSAYSYKLPEIQPVEYSKKDLLVDPYLLGLLIGDGSMCGSSLSFSTDDTELLFYIKFILGNKYDIKKCSGNEYGYIITSKIKGCNQLLRDIRSLGLGVKSYDKFIPIEYKRGSIEQRLEIVRGLMDTDGTVSENGNARFTSSSERLIDDLAYVFRSLGVRCRKAKTNLGGKLTDFGNGHSSIVRDSWILSITTTTEIFRLQRKAKKLKRSGDKRILGRFNRIGIKSVKKLDYQEDCTCIYVDSDDHLYLTKDFIVTHNSFKSSSMACRNYHLIPKSKSYFVADTDEYLTKDGLINKAWQNTSFLNEHSEFKKMSDKVNRPKHKRASFVDPEDNIEKGYMSEMMGITTNDDPDKVRGKAGKLMLFEEGGKNKHLMYCYNIAKSSFEQGRRVFGTMLVYGTGGTEGADFSGLLELFYNPIPYDIMHIKNIYDKAQNNAYCGYFSPEYINREDCYDTNGNSDVIKALIEILEDRNRVRHTSDSNVLVARKAEQPITPVEAVMKKEGSFFPVADIREYLANIIADERKFCSGHHVVDLVIDSLGTITPSISLKTPIREYPIGRDISKQGSIEIFEMPDFSLKFNYWRYIGGIDPIDDDYALYSDSLGSIFIFDRFKRRIVAEYTGRPQSANEFYEICHRLLRFYNALANYENNKKGLFAYFDQHHLLKFLCDTPKVLKDQDMIKDRGMYGNKLKGFNANEQINAWGRRLQLDWMMQPAYESDGEEKGKINLHTIRSIGYLKELLMWNPDANFDRVSSMGACLILDADMAKYELVKVESNEDPRHKSLKEYRSLFFKSQPTNIHFH